jgi:hypothetical protein
MAEIPSLSMLLCAITLPRRDTVAILNGVRGLQIDTHKRKTRTHHEI